MWLSLLTLYEVSSPWACGQLGSLHQILEPQAEPLDTGEEQDRSHGWLCSPTAAQLHVYTHRACRGSSCLPKVLWLMLTSTSLTWPWLPFLKADSTSRLSKPSPWPWTHLCLSALKTFNVEKMSTVVNFNSLIGLWKPAGLSKLSWAHFSAYVLGPPCRLCVVLCAQHSFQDKQELWSAQFPENLSHPRSTAHSAIPGDVTLLFTVTYLLPDRCCNTNMNLVGRVSWRVSFFSSSWWAFHFDVYLVPW